MRWYRGVARILSLEPETSLAYLYGTKLGEIPHLREKKRKYSGLLLQTLFFLYRHVRRISLRKMSLDKARPDFLVVADTLNQMVSLDGTVDSLRAKPVVVEALAHRKFLKDPEYRNKYRAIRFGPSDIGKCVCLIALRGPRLLRELKKKDPLLTEWYLSEFLDIYIYLPFFLSLLQRSQPKFVVTSNDHNPLNRCLLAAAHYLDIKTVYLQHASVSKLFPPLRVNYAFLDGQSALETYRQCEGNLSKDIVKNYPIPLVFLSGQKKKIISSCSSGRVGVALNALDCVEEVIKFVDRLASQGVQVSVRWHPSQKNEDTVRIRDIFKGNSSVYFNDPRTTNISEYLGSVGYLVAGNSSVHLEAALSNVVPIYYDFKSSSSYDYYGYVRSGVALKAESPEEVLGILKCDETELILNESSIRYYSSTYKTEWEGRESELTSECLVSISSGGAVPIAPLDLLDYERVGIGSDSSKGLRFV